jgi:ABC-2 type transport system ATP-binding protein
VLVSSHLMSELEDTADQLVIVGRGKVIADTSVAGLLAAASGDRALLRATDPDRAAMVLERAGASVTVTGAGLLTVTGLDTGQISALLAGQAVPFSELSAHRATLEEAYLGLTQDAVEYRAVQEVRP